MISFIEVFQDSLLNRKRRCKSQSSNLSFIVNLELYKKSMHKLFVIVKTN